MFGAIQSIDAGTGSPVGGLSDRELEVFQHLGKGLGTREIGDTLRISAKTVETHRAHIKEKLNCKTSSEAVRFAIDWVTRENG
jgi:DNA-binding CsgD family transcriptional regulator